METQNRKPVAPEDERKVRFWAEALLRGANPVRAAQELYSLGVRTRGAVRCRGSARSAAPSRFPPGTPASELLNLLRAEATPEILCGVANALGEWGGPEALSVLRALAVGEQRDSHPSVRAAALDAIGIIGGPDAVRILKEVERSDEDPVLRDMAQTLIPPLMDAG